MAQIYTTTMSINHCPFGIKHFGSAEAIKDEHCICCSHPVCDGQYWFTKTKKSDIRSSSFQKNTNELLKALHVNRNQGGKNKSAWEILQDKDPAHNKGQQSVFGSGTKNFKPNREKATWKSHPTTLHLHLLRTHE